MARAARLARELQLLLAEPPEGAHAWTSVCVSVQCVVA